MANKWLEWTPDRDETIATSGSPAPPRPSELGFDGFEGEPSEHSPIIQGHGEAPQPGEDSIAKMGNPVPSKPSEPSTGPALPLVLALDGVPGPKEPLACPAIPKGIRLIRWEPKPVPVAIDVCSVVVDLPKFIESELRALDSRLNNPCTIHGGFTVPQMLDRLAQAGLEVELDPKGGVSK